MGSSVSAQHREEAALLEACADGDAAAVRAAIASSTVDVDCFDDEGSTPLHVAAFCGHTELVRLLLAASRASLEAKGQLGGTPLHVAATARRLEAARELVAARAAIDASDESGLRPLHRAAAAGDAAIVSLLLAAGAAVDATTVDGYTPLHVSATRGRGRYAVVEALVKANARLDARVATGETAAELLRRGAGEEDAAALALLEAGGAASPPPSPPPSPRCVAPGRPIDAYACDDAPLARLPQDALVLVSVRAGVPSAPLALGATCRMLREVMDADDTWRAAFAATYAPVVRHCFSAAPESVAGGDEAADAAARLARPAAGESWKHFAVRFGCEWMHDAFTHRGIVVTLLHGRAYDVTNFVDEHPHATGETRTHRLFIVRPDGSSVRIATLLAAATPSF